MPFAAVLEGGRDTEERLGRVGGSDPDTGQPASWPQGPSSQRVGVPSCADSSAWPGWVCPGTPGRPAEKGELEIGQSQVNMAEY